jgi:hypothetical protein
MKLSHLFGGGLGNWLFKCFKISIDFKASAVGVTVVIFFFFSSGVPAKSIVAIQIGWWRNCSPFEYPRTEISVQEQHDAMSWPRDSRIQGTAADAAAATGCDDRRRSWSSRQARFFDDPFSDKCE